MILFPIAAMNFLGSKKSLTDIPETTATRKRVLAISQRNTIAGNSCESEKCVLLIVLTAVTWRPISERKIFHWILRPTGLETLCMVNK
jgi:hypothetical protein